MAKLLEDNMESHRELLHKLVPHYLMKNVISKITLEAHCCVQSIPDAVVLAMRIRAVQHRLDLRSAQGTEADRKARAGGSYSSEGDSASISTNTSKSGTNTEARSNRYASLQPDSCFSQLEDEDAPESTPSPAVLGAGGAGDGALTFVHTFRAHFRAVETALHQLNAEAAHCSLFHVMGDLVLIGGPMIDLQARREAKLQKSEVEMTRFKTPSHGDNRHIRFQEEAAGRCGKMLVSAVASMQETFGGNLTASLAHGNGYAAVLGEVLPSFDLLGPACRAAHEILDASPDGSIGCTEGFIKFISDCDASAGGARNNLDYWPESGFEVPQRATSWRLRGAGQVRVVPLKRKVPTTN